MLGGLWVLRFRLFRGDELFSIIHGFITVELNTKTKETLSNLGLVCTAKNLLGLEMISLSLWSELGVFFIIFILDSDVDSVYSFYLLLIVAFCTLRYIY